MHYQINDKNYDTNIQKIDFAKLTNEISFKKLKIKQKISLKNIFPNYVSFKFNLKCEKNNINSKDINKNKDRNFQLNCFAKLTNESK